MNSARAGLEISNAPVGRHSILFDTCRELLEHPVTRESIEIRADGAFVGAQSGQLFPASDGIPNLFVPNDWQGAGQPTDVTDVVKAFYEETPFPNYDDFDSRQSLSTKARRGVFAALLDEQIPPGAVILEAGCGTGQLSNFLGMGWNRKVFAGDICLNSLRLAKKFADQYSIRNVAFLQMNLFRPPFRDESLDLIISNGVLHHTGDCKGGFRSLLTKLKPGGHIAIGLYNSYARLPTLWKSWVFRRFGSKLYWLDHRLADWSSQPDRIKAWFMDQYCHPHETRHSIDEVLDWFREHNVEFVNGIPHPDGSEFEADEELFASRRPGTALTRLSTQLDMLLSGGADGGLFIMIGRKRT